MVMLYKPHHLMRVPVRDCTDRRRSQKTLTKYRADDSDHSRDAVQRGRMIYLSSISFCLANMEVPCV